MISTVFGIIAICCVFAWPFFVDYRTSVKIQGSGSAEFALYFLAIGSPTAAIACLIACSQLAISIAVKDRYIVTRLYGASFIILISLSVATWHGMASVLVFIGSSLATFARLQTSTHRMKALFLVGAPFWLVHNLMAGAFFALSSDFVSLASNVINLTRHLRRKGCPLSAPMAQI
ncbi:YgjV family protein [Novosphingobium sp. CECT 9465]|uniref:YgjV family protein n=1 Tax=Novosphingobium sp. CECT 9465 TaxID=2829794 RepID=UPI001E364C52|nr:YgjV family protein [Novosphingobium sp. CECT 9465]